MYSIGDIFKGMNDPRAAAREVNRLCHTRGRRHRFNPSGTGIFELDWDTLVILDACRYDFFEQVADLPGRTEYRYSLASATYEFVPANFAGRKLWDTVYVGANIWFLKLKEEIGSDIYKFINLQSDDPAIEWADEELNVPTPSTVTNHALDTAVEYPDKRLIVHYLQPHHPFIGPIGREHFDYESSSLIEVVRRSDASDEELQKAYRENLEIVLKEVERLLSTLEGKTVVTADHGEMLGDRHDYLPVQDYGHHAEIFNDPSVKVPLHVYEQGPRPTIRSEQPEPEQALEPDEVNEQLRALGYKV